jgi:hypothetical protein
MFSPQRFVARRSWISRWCAHNSQCEIVVKFVHRRESSLEKLRMSIPGLSLPGTLRELFWSEVKRFHGRDFEPWANEHFSKNVVPPASALEKSAYLVCSNPFLLNEKGLTISTLTINELHSRSGQKPSRESKWFTQILPRTANSRPTALWFKKPNALSGWSFSGEWVTSTFWASSDRRMSNSRFLDHRTAGHWVICISQI